MATRVGLRTKLLLVSLGLVILPVMIVGGVSIWRINGFSRTSMQRSSAALESQVQENLGNSVQMQTRTVEILFDGMYTDAQRLATSANVTGYLSAMEGTNEVWNQVIGQMACQEVESMLTLCQSHSRAIDRQLQHNLAVADHMLRSYGSVRLSDRQTVWNAVNQLTKVSESTSLPVLQIGANLQIEPNDSLEIETPVVDAIAHLVGGTCTIFQRMNDKGDMFRVATNVKLQSGKRAIGTYIPVQGPDGKPTPVLAQVLQGRPYSGRAFVVDDWCATAYMPLADDSGRIIGMLYVGLKEQENAELADAIGKMRIGQSGYAFVTDGQGKILVHPRSELLGKNLITDLHLDALKPALVERSADRSDCLTYAFQNRQKLAAHTYFKEWDWVLFVTGYQDEVTRQVGEASRQCLIQEMQKICDTSSIKDGNECKSLYGQARFLGQDGKEIVKIQCGKVDNDLVSKADSDWFREACKLPAGEVYTSAVEIAINTGLAEVRAAAPVYYQGKLKGVVAFNLDWQVVQGLLARTRYGKTGYPYIINDKGMVLAHPTFAVKDQVSLADAKFGNLAEIVREHMIKGERGIGRYVFEGVEKVVGYTPLPIGKRTYCLAAAVPAKEVLAAVQDMQVQARTETRITIVTIIASLAVLGLLGAMGGMILARSIAGPLQKIIAGLAGSAQTTTDASGQVARSSQQMAEGASEQASSLEEVSSSLEEMASMTKQNADNAGQANTMASQAASAAEEGNAAMTRMADAINQIKNSSDQTAKIVKTIDEIAFQTNLLALNAAVEAARAGEAGKGFAVVAEEVRNLAQRSAEAAKNTSSLIEESQKNADNGVAVSTEVAKILGAIVTGVQKVNQLIGEVSTASKEQSQGIEQINTAVAQMDKVTQANAANAEESASASEELSAQARELNDMVNTLSEIVTGSAASVSNAPSAARAGTPSHNPAGSTAAQAGHLDKMLHQTWQRQAAGPVATYTTERHEDPGKDKDSCAAQSASPEKAVIPLDDSELQQF